MCVSLKVDRVLFFNLLGVNRGEENTLTDYFLDLMS